MSVVDLRSIIDGIIQGTNFILGSSRSEEKDSWCEPLSRKPCAFITGQAVLTLLCAYPSDFSELREALSFLQAQQNIDGGWGDYKRSESTLVGTSFATQALFALNKKVIAKKGLDWIGGNMKNDGGHGLTKDEPSETRRTALALKTLTLSEDKNLLEKAGRSLKWIQELQDSSTHGMPERKGDIASPRATAEVANVLSQWSVKLRLEKYPVPDLDLEDVLMRAEKYLEKRFGENQSKYWEDTTFRDNHQFTTTEAINFFLNRGVPLGNKIIQNPIKWLLEQQEKGGWSDKQQGAAPCVGGTYDGVRCLQRYLIEYLKTSPNIVVQVFEHLAKLRFHMKDERQIRENADTLVSVAREDAWLLEVGIPGVLKVSKSWKTMKEKR